MLEFSGRVAGTVSLGFTENDICNIIVGAFEGGSNHWMGVDNTTPEWTPKPKNEPLSTWATKILLDGGEVILYDIEDESEVFHLTLEKLLNGIRMYINSRCGINKDDLDAVDMDCIIQYAVCGKIAYS